MSFNECIDQGKFPYVLKYANIKAKFKKFTEDLKTITALSSLSQLSPRYLKNYCASR